ncbi:MAG: LD-carboxypeptidase [Metamycoplasmataceae bacterium]
MKNNKLNVGIYNVTVPIISIFPQKAKRAEKILIYNGFNVVYGNLAFSNKSCYTTGSPMERANEINNLISNKKIDILLPSIGGDNTSSILEYLNYDKIAKSNIKIIGHSNTTALILAVYAMTKKITYYGASFIVGFDNQNDINEFHIKSLIDNCINDKLGLLEIPKEYTSLFIPWTNLDPVPNKEMTKNKMITISKGVIEGVIIGGNLNTFIPLLGTKYFPDVDHNTILFFEDTCQSDNLNLAQVEKNLSSLRNSEILHKIGGLIIGKCEGFEKISKGIKYVDFIKDFIYDLNIPIIAEFDFAHTLPIVTIAIGSTVRLNTINQTLARIK